MSQLRKASSTASQLISRIRNRLAITGSRSLLAHDSEANNGRAQFERAIQWQEVATAF
jgi:hypothetical protein